MNQQDWISFTSGVLNTANAMRDVAVGTMNELATAGASTITKLSATGLVTAPLTGINIVIEKGMSGRDWQQSTGVVLIGTGTAMIASAALPPILLAGVGGIMARELAAALIGQLAQRQLPGYIQPTTKSQALNHLVDNSAELKLGQAYVVGLADGSTVAYTKTSSNTFSEIPLPITGSIASIPNTSLNINGTITLRGSDPSGNLVTITKDQSGKIIRAQLNSSTTGNTNERTAQLASALSAEHQTQEGAQFSVSDSASESKKRFVSSSDKLNEALSKEGLTINQTYVQGIRDSNNNLLGHLIDEDASISGIITTSFGTVADLLFGRTAAISTFVSNLGQNFLSSYRQYDSVNTTPLLSEFTSRLLTGENIDSIAQSIITRELTTATIGAVIDGLQDALGNNWFLTGDNTALLKASLADYVAITVLASRDPSEAVHQIVTSQVIDNVIRKEQLLANFLRPYGVSQSLIDASGAAVSAAGLRLITAVLNGDGINTQTAIQAGISAGQAALTLNSSLTSVFGAAGNGIPLGTILGQPLNFNPIGFAISVGVSIVASKLFAPTQYIHGETLSHITQIQPDGSLLLIGAREAGSLLRTTGTTNDDYIGNDSANDTAGHDVIVGQAGMNEIYARGGHDFMEGRAAADYIDAGTGDDHVEAGDGDDYVTAGNGNDRVYGQNGNDILLGDAGDDVVLGGAGDDRIEGGTGNDELYGGSGADQIVGGAGTDVIDGGTGDDILAGEADADEIDGGDGNDTVQGGDGNDVIAGGEGNDNLDGNAGNDRVVGGAGVDVLYGGEGNDALDGGLDNDLLFGGIGHDTLSGGYANDDLYGEIGSDLLAGGGGDDLLAGGADDDLYIFRSGDGHDTIDDIDGINTVKLTDMNVGALTAITRVGDSLKFAFGTYDSLTVKDHFITPGVAKVEFANGQAIDVSSLTFDGSGVGSYASLLSGQNVLASFSSQFTAYQRSTSVFNASTVFSTGWLTDNYDTRVTTSSVDAELYNDIQVRSWSKGGGLFSRKKVFFYDYYETLLRGSGGVDRIVGMFTSETIDGAGGNDQLYGNVGDDTVLGGTDHDMIFGGAGADNLQGQTGNDLAFGGSGNDTITGLDGNDTAFGEAGNDTINGGTGEDYLSGDDGDDTVSGGTGRDILFGGDGNDTLNGDEDDDYLAGGTGTNILNGGAGNDLLFGGIGNDTMTGGDGDDIIVSGGGTDTVDGGAGTDTLILSGRLIDYSVAIGISGAVTVTDLRPGAPDGTMTASNVESLAFSDQTILINEVFPSFSNLTIAPGASISSAIPLASGFTAALVAAPTQGTLSLASNGSYTYAAPSVFTGNTTFRYRLTSPQGITRDTDVAVTIASTPAGSGAFTLAAPADVATYTHSSGGDLDYRIGTRSAVLNDGSYVVVWSSAQDGSANGVYAQRYSANGTALGASFRVNTTTGDQQYCADVSSTQDGGFIVTWSSYYQNGDNGLSIQMQRYTAAGTAVGVETRVNVGNNLDQYLSKVVRLAGGHNLFVWQTQQTSNTLDIYARVMDASGNFLAPEFKVNSVAPSHQFYPDVAALNDGGFVIVWQDTGGRDGAGDGIYAQRYDSSYVAVGADFRVNTTTANSQVTPKVAALTNGGFVVTWSSLAEDGSGWGIYGQRYNGSGVAQGAAFQVNTTTSNDQRLPDITSLSDGGFYVTWQSNLQDGSGIGIYGQRFNLAGVSVGSETLLNQVTTNDQQAPSITELTNGDLIVSWQSTDTTPGKVVSRRLILPVGAGLDLTGTADADVQAGSALADTLTGSAGNDIMLGHGGNDVLAGGDGTDTAQYSGNLAHYAVSIINSTITVSDGRGGAPDGIDTLTSIEKLSFADQTVDLTTLFPSIPNIIIAPGKTLNGTLGLAPGFTANVVQGPTKGTLVLASNGTYTYTAPATTGTPTSFTYRLTSASGITRDATVNVTFPSYVNPTGQHTLGATTTLGTSHAVTTGDHDIRAATRSTLLDDGSYVVVWCSNASDGSMFGVYAQRFNAAGTKLGALFRVNVTTTNHQYCPDVTSTADGGFIVTWSSYYQNGDNGLAVYSRRYTAAGTAVTGEVQVNTYNNLDQYFSKVIRLTDGRNLFVWQTQQSGLTLEIYGRLMDSSGTFVAPEFKINTHATSSKWYPDIAALPNGGFVTVWQDSGGQDGSADGIYAQIFDNTATKVGGEFRINTTTAASQVTPRVAVLKDGSFIVLWASAGQDTSGWGVYAQRFSAAGVALGAEFAITTTFANDQRLPDVTALTGGGFYAVWQSNLQDGSGTGIYGRAFSADGVPQTPETQINAVTTNNQQAPSVLELANGDLIISYQSFEATPTQAFTRRLVLPNTGGYTEFGTTAVEAIVGSAFADAILADGANDIIRGEGGSDTIDGGNGTDTVQFSGARADYTVTVTNTSTVVQDMRPGSPDGTDTLTSVENVQFTDQTIGLVDLFPDIKALTIPVSTSYTGSFTVPAGYTISNPFGAPSSGTVSIAGDGTFTYTPVAGYVGAATFNYRLTAPNGVQQDATVAVTVLPPTVSQNSYTPGTEENLATVSLDYVGSYDARCAVKTVALTGGGHVTAWVTIDTDGTSHNVYYQVFQANGTAVGPAVRANTTVADTQLNLEIANLSAGGFVLSWQNPTINSSVWRRFDATGTAQTSEIRILPTVSGGGYWDNPISAVVELADGNIASVWSGRMGPGDYQIYMNRFSPDGVALGAPTLVNTSGGGTQVQPRVTRLTNGNLAVVWEDQGGADGSGSGIYLQIMTPAGTTYLTEKRVNTATANAQTWPDVVSIGATGFIVTWQSQYDASGTGVYGQRFDNDGTKLGAEFLINSATTGDQARASVTALPDGGFFATWHSMGQDGSGAGVYGKRYDSSGNTIGAELRLSDTTLNDQRLPDITTLQNGDLIVAWHSFDGTNPKVVQKRFVAPSTANGLNINASSTNDVIAGTPYADTLTGNDGNDVFYGGAGNDLMVGNAGNDTYRFGSGYGSDIVNNQDSAGTDRVLVDTGIGVERLWFEQKGLDLKLSLLNTTDSLTLQNWFTTDAQKVDSFTLSNGTSLDKSKVDALIGAMASFNPAAIGTVTSLGDLPGSVQNVIAANWS